MTVVMQKTANSCLGGKKVLHADVARSQPFGRSDRALETSRVANGFRAVVVLCMLLCMSSVSASATFPIDAKYAGSTACSFYADAFSLVPGTGQLVIALSAGLQCAPGALIYPTPVINAESAATLAVSPLLVSGSGQVVVTLTTGVPSATPGLNCMPDGIEATSTTVVSGWSTLLCSNCGSSTTRVVEVSHSGGALPGNVRFKARCSYADPAHPRITTELGGISAALPVSVNP